MARFIGDFQKVAGIHESGTYAQAYKSGTGMTGSAYWIGQVTDHSIDDAENYMEDRYMGTATQNFDTMEQGPKDLTGTLTYHPHDMRYMFYAIGSIVEVSGATLAQATHAVTEVNSNVWQSPFTSGTGTHPAPMSFSLEDSKQSPGANRNFNREVHGVVGDVTTLTLTQGEKATIEIAYIAENLLFDSGTTINLINSGTNVSHLISQALTPYMWDDSILTLGGQGTDLGSVMDTAKEIVFAVNRNMTGPHYNNGSRVIGTPYTGKRDYTIDVTMDLDGLDAHWLYRQYYRGGSAFNASLDLNADITAVGSKHTHFIFSGCKITAMDNPSNAEADTTETTLTVRPQSVAGSAWDRTHLYNPW